MCNIFKIKSENFNYIKQIQNYYSYHYNQKLENVNFT